MKNQFFAKSYDEVKIKLVAAGVPDRHRRVGFGDDPASLGGMGYRPA